MSGREDEDRNDGWCGACKDTHFETVCEAIKQRDLLQQALAQVLAKAGVTRSDCLPSGPELLVIAQEYVSSTG